MSVWHAFYSLLCFLTLIYFFYSYVCKNVSNYSFKNVFHYHCLTVGHKQRLPGSVTSDYGSLQHLVASGDKSPTARYIDEEWFNGGYALDRNSSLRLSKSRKLCSQFSNMLVK